MLTQEDMKREFYDIRDGKSRSFAYEHLRRVRRVIYTGILVLGLGTLGSYHYLKTEFHDSNLETVTKNSTSTSEVNQDYESLKDQYTKELDNIKHNAEEIQNRYDSLTIKHEEINEKRKNEKEFAKRLQHKNTSLQEKIKELEKIPSEYYSLKEKYETIQERTEKQIKELKEENNSLKYQLEQENLDQKVKIVKRNGKVFHYLNKEDYPQVQTRQVGEYFKKICKENSPNNHRSYGISLDDDIATVVNSHTGEEIGSYKAYVGKDVSDGIYDSRGSAGGSQNVGTKRFTYSWVDFKKGITAINANVNEAKLCDQYYTVIDNSVTIFAKNRYVESIRVLEVKNVN